MKYLLLDFVEKKPGDNLPVWLSEQLQQYFHFDAPINPVHINEQFILLLVDKTDQKNNIETVSSPKMLDSLRVPYERFNFPSKKFLKNVTEWLHRTTGIKHKLQRQEAI